MAWPEKYPKDRTRMGAYGQKIQEDMPSAGQVITQGARTAIKPLAMLTAPPREFVGKLARESNVGQDFARRKELIRQMNQPGRDAASPLPSGSRSKLSQIPFTGANVPSEVPTLTSQKIAAIDPKTERMPSNQSMSVNTGGPLMFTNVPGGLHGFNTGNTDRSRLNKPKKLSQYTISDSQWTPEEMKKFSQTPVSGGTRARSGPGFGNRPEGGWSPRTGHQLEDIQPRDQTVLGSLGTGNRDYDQRVANETASELALINARNNALAAQESKNIQANQEKAALKEFGVNRRFAISQKYMEKKDVLDRKVKTSRRGKDRYNFIADVDPITGKKLSTGKFYNGATGEWSDEAPVKDPTADYLNQFMRTK